MKKLLVVSAFAALGLNSVVLAGGLPEEMPMAPAAVSTSETGVYLGISGGFGMTNWKNFKDYLTAVDDGATASVGKDSGFVGRALLGYDITRYFALEFGYSYFFNKPEISWSDATPVSKLKTMAFDLMLKGKLPVVENFDLFAKLGANYLMTKCDCASIRRTDPVNDGDLKGFNVAFGAGADYYITPNIIASVEWLRFNGKSKLEYTNTAPTGLNKAQPHTDSFLFGLRYKIEI